jgi:eukaryotic-like serine/threonine-protein kinase
MRSEERLDQRFELESRIASGGMGDVFRARDPSSGEVVAVKIMPGARGPHAERFTREIEVLAELDHPGVVRYISHGVTPAGEPFLVMEWLDGEVLQARLERGALPVADAITLAARVAGALGAVHARGIVHRDLKPSNLFLLGGRVEQVKVLDFGIAQRYGRTQLTRTGMILGTPGYMAPEQARTGGAVDARADVFALGCVLFHCLTGVPPFEGGDTAAVLAKIVFGATPRIRELWPEAPTDLDALLARMLAHEPSLRPSDGADLAAALASLRPAVPGMASASRDRATVQLVFHGGERRLRAVVMLGSTDQDDEAIEAALQQAARSCGGRLAQLSDGSTVVVLDADRQVATDQAAQAARCALAMRAIASHRPLAIAMGRSEATGALPAADVIDHASRLLTDAAPPPGGLPPIALDEMSAGLLDARFDVIERQGQLVLCGERALVQGARTLLGRPTSCVGRDWELGALTGICDECVEEGEARVALVTAAAGMGKSRLGAELVSRLRDRHPGIAIWVGRGDSLRAGSTLDLLAQALRGALGIHEGEPLPERLDKIRARVAEHVPPGDQRRVAEFLGELVGAPFPDGDALHAARQDAQLMSGQMRKAWLDFLRAETAAHPILLLLDDLHWGDFGTVRFIDAALRERGDRPWMVLALARPEVFEVLPRLWADRPSVQAIRLEALGRKASERLIRQVLGDGVGSDTVERLAKQADGNAFYLEELIRTAAEGKDAALPETVLAMVETRLARLPFEARQVLRAASVFGEVCWEGGAIAVLDGMMPASAVAEWLAQLVEHEVLVVRPDSRFPGERELAFRHALLREGAYVTLTDDDRALGHRRAGDWLDQHGEGNPMVLAGHFERGGEAARAAHHYLRAAQQAIQVLDPQAAMARTALGLACAPPPELRIDLLGIRCEASQAVHQIQMDEAEELLRLAPPGSVPWAQGMFAYNAGLLLAGRIEERLASVARLHDVPPHPGAAGWMAFTLLSSIFFLDLVGRVPQGTALEASFHAFIRDHGDQEPIARIWWHVAGSMRSSYAHDDPWAGLQHSMAIQPIYDAIGGDLNFVFMQLLRAKDLWYLGAFPPAVQALEAVPVADTALGMVGTLRRFALAWLYADRGELARARALAIQAAESGRAHKNRQEEARGHWALAEALRRDGDLADADRELQVALRIAVPLDQPGVRATLSALRLAQGRAGEALAAAEDAMARCTAMGGCGLFRGAFVRLAHAEALHATGAHDAARDAIARARAYLLAVADKIADPGYRASFLEQVPENARTLALAGAWLGPPAPADRWIVSR